MATARAKIDTRMKVLIELDEDEAGALGAICGYGAEAFLKTFKQHMGRSYIEPFEHAVPKLFDSLRGLDNRVKDARKALQELKL